MLIDNPDESQSELDIVEQKKLDSTIEQVTDDIPEKYKGKQLSDIIKMHQEAEKLIGKQAQEVGEVRKLADELIKQNLAGKPQPIKEEEPEVDFFENPQAAVRKTVDTHPDVLAARQAAQEFKKMQIQSKLSQEHPDFGQVVQDSDFVNWVKSSPVRIGLYAKADGEYDYDSANELLTTYKQLKGIKENRLAMLVKANASQTLKPLQLM